MAYCIYLRKSRADLEAEASGEGETLARHEHILLDLARRDGYAVTEIYREIVSGETIAARPVMQQLLSEVEAGLWTGVLVVEVERLARGDSIDQGIVSQAFKYSGTKIITPSKVYDPDNEFDETFFEFGLFMSRQEYRTINRRMKQGRESSAREGKWVIGRAPYGYERVRVDQGKGWTLRPVEPAAGTVRYIFQSYVTPDADGRMPGMWSIAARLSELGIDSPAASGSWSESELREILRNPVYIGKVRYNNYKTKKKLLDGKVSRVLQKSPAEDVILVAGLHPAIISEELFYAVQDRLDRSGPPPVSGKRELKNPLSGVLRCAVCGRSLASSVTAGYRYVFCNRAACNNHMSRLALVEDRLLESIAEWLDGYRIKWQEADQADCERYDGGRKKAIAATEKELSGLRGQLSRAHDLLERGVYDTETFLSRSAELASRIETVEARAAKLSAELAEWEQDEAARRGIVPKAEHLLAVYRDLPSAQAKNDLLKEVLDRVEYSRPISLRTSGVADDFELVIYPKLPSPV